jgi:hypothetical protein
MANILVLEASQSADKVNVCRYSLLKYLEVHNLKPPANTAVYVYTDQPAFFESFISFFHRFEIKEISQTQLKEWSGIGSAQRVKMEIISEVLSHTGGNLLFLDTNTYIKAPLENIFAGIEKGYFFLHSYKASLNSAVDTELSQLNKFLATDAIWQNGQKLSIEDIRIWNTNVIGLNSTYKAVLDDITELNDVIYKQFPKPVVEAFAFSYCLQKAGEVKTCNEQIPYYGSLKEFRQLLQLFFKKNEEESIPNLIKLLNVVDVATIQKHKISYESLPFYKKWLQIITGKSWNIKQYEKKF